MKKRWYHKFLTAIAVALICLLIRCLVSGQGYLTCRVFGLDFGFAHLKTFFYLVWWGKYHWFPLDGILLGAVGLAMYFSFGRFHPPDSDS